MGGGEPLSHSQPFLLPTEMASALLQAPTSLSGHTLPPHSRIQHQERYCTRRGGFGETPG